MSEARMFKIKDDVELRELMKYGFKYTGNYNRGDIYKREMYITVNGVNLDGIMVGDSRKIGYIFPYIKNIEYPDIEIFIKDLIQAGLVEKVEE